MRLDASVFSLLHHRRQIQLSSSLFFSSAADTQSQTHLKPQVLNKTPQLNPQISNKNRCSYISKFLSLAQTLIQNPKNLKTLAHLDSFLSHTPSFDSITSVAVFEGLCRLKKLNRAKILLLHLKDNLKVSPYFAFSLVFDCLVKDGKLDDVETQWGEICGGYGINLSYYVINVCKCGELEEIKRVCDRILMGSSRVLGRQSYVALIGALCRYDEGLWAKFVLHEMYCKGFRVDDVTYIVMFQCFCRNGELDEADWVLRKMVKGGCDVDVCIYGSFMHGLCKAGKFREANKLFNKLTKRNSFPNSKSKLLKERRRAIFQLKLEGVIPEMMVYEMYFRSLCSAGKLDVAEILLKKMMKKRALPQICVYGSFIKALFRAGREEDALKFFNLECKKGLVCPNELARFVIMQLCEKGRVEDAIRILDEYVGKGEFVNCVTVCNCLLGSLWSLGKTNEAESFFERMSNGGLASPNLCSYRHMVCGFCDQGNLTKALNIFKDVQSENIPVDGIMCARVISALCQHGRFEEAYDHLNDMIRRGCVVSYTMWKRMFHLLIVDGDKHLY